MFGLDYICCKRHLSTSRALNSCRQELKPDHPVSALSPSPSFSLLLSLSFLLFESDTQSILITLKSEGRQDLMFKRVVSKTAVVPFLFTA